jgi:PadR family transcriptional regulator, regulatory protein PadR
MSDDKNLNDYERKMLEGWEDVFKKGQLTLWIMLAIKDGAKHMSEIKDFIFAATHGNVTADDQSMYRALRRYTDAELLEYTTEPGEGGPDRKVYNLTLSGLNVLQSFLQRNIVNTFYNSELKKLVLEESGHER